MVEGPLTLAPSVDHIHFPREHGRLDLVPLGVTPEVEVDDGAIHHVSDVEIGVEVAKLGVAEPEVARVDR